MAGTIWDLQISGYWPLTETGSADRVDLNQGYHDLTAVNAPGVDLAYRGWKNALDLNAANSETLYCASSSLLTFGNDNSFTIGVWIKPHNVAADSRIISKWIDGGNREYQIYMSSGKIYFAVNSGTTNYIVAANAHGPLSNHNWYFIIALYDKDSDYMAVGVNDIFDWASGPAGGINAFTTNPLYFGSHRNVDSYYDGLMAEAFIYHDRWLDKDERTWFYHNGGGRTWEDIEEFGPPTIPYNPFREIDETPLIYSLKDDLTVQAIIDDYYSLSWTERYNACGEFELELPIDYLIDLTAKSYVSLNTFLYNTNSETVMIVEETKIEKGEDKWSLVVSGRSAESLLSRRVIVNPVSTYGLAEKIIYRQMWDNLLNPSDSARQMTVFDNTFIPKLDSYAEFEEVFENQTLYDVVTKICQQSGLGFRVVRFDPALYTGGNYHGITDHCLFFYTYEGTDYSLSQTPNPISGATNPHVILAEGFDNILESSYIASNKDKANIVLLITGDSNPLLERIFIWGNSGRIPPTDLLENLVDFWELEEDGSAARVGSYNNISLAATNSPSLNSDGIHGNCLDLELGSNQSVGSAGSSVTPTGSFSVGCWVKPESDDNDAGFQYIISQEGSTVSASSFILRRVIADSKLYFYIASGSTLYGPATSTGTIPVGEWTFVSAVYDADNNKLKVRINDDDFDEVTISSVTINSPTTTKFVIGGRDGTDRQMDGMIDDVFFYDQRALVEDDLNWYYGKHDFPDIYDVLISKPTGINRWEAIKEETISRNEVTPVLSDYEVLLAVTQRGREYLKDRKSYYLIDGDIITEGIFSFGVDYKLGDIVECNLYGANAKARVIESTRSYSSEGLKFHITLDFDNV